MRRISKFLLLGAAAMAPASCDTAQVDRNHVVGIWGGPHAGLDLQGGLGDAEFDCAAGTIDDPLYAGADGTFSLKGSYRAGAPGPVKVGQIFRSQGAVYSGRIASGPGKNSARVMTLQIALDDGTSLGPFTLTEGAPPQLTRCL
jgi:hypothetical protein